MPPHVHTYPPIWMILIVLPLVPFSNAYLWLRSSYYRLKVAFYLRGIKWKDDKRQYSSDGFLPNPDEKNLYWDDFYCKLLREYSNSDQVEFVLSQIYLKNKIYGMSISGGIWFRMEDLYEKSEIFRKISPRYFPKLKNN